MFGERERAGVARKVRAKSKWKWGGERVGYAGVGRDSIGDVFGGGLGEQAAETRLPAVSLWWW